MAVSAKAGMGNYHGQNGFDTFSHTKSVIKQNFLFDVSLRYAPYKDKIGLVKKVFKIKLLAANSWTKYVIIKNTEYSINKKEKYALIYCYKF